jgi:acetolactate synthase-1/2/3 large subunit
MHGGDIIASVLAAQGTRFLFTLCGGHISPILTGCKARGIRVVDTRHEATAVFAADAVARLTGRPGVAAVTAGPGLTNTITAVKNAQVAQSPVVLLGGAAPTLLRGRGALQDIDQMPLIRPHVKWAAAVRRVRDLAPALERAFHEALSGVPGPAFVECPIDLLYDEATVRRLYGAGGGRSLADRAVRAYLGARVGRMFAGAGLPAPAAPIAPAPPAPDLAQVAAAAELLRRAERPVLLIGSQALLDVPAAAELARAVERIGAPVYLSGMARGLLGAGHPLQMRHKRREALRAADLVLLAGVPCDFRLDYGRQIRRGATYIAANRSPRDLRLNRRPAVAALGDPALFVCALADVVSQEPRAKGQAATSGSWFSVLGSYLYKRGSDRTAPSDATRAERWGAWLAELRARDDARNAEIAAQAAAPSQRVNPVHLCRAVAAAHDPGAIIVGDGGDFVATASYIVSPGGPLAWLDPGPFGTLGVGAGFALGAKLVHPEREVWALFGDGALGYSLAELDTFARHGVPIIAVVGNDAGWTQIARDQVEILGDDVGTALAPTEYHRAAEGLGAAGLALDDPELADEVLAQARALAAAGRPVLVNALLGKTDFRKGSISV